MTRLLLLGGTAEARVLAGKLAGMDGLDARLSLAGATDNPVAQPIATRTGGFGGAAGLGAYLRAENIDLMVDATHPFAAQMTGNAIAAAAQTGVPLAHVVRPQWDPLPGEDWIRVPTLEAAAQVLPEGARVFSATGRGSVPVLSQVCGLYLCLRVIDPSDAPFPGTGEYVVARPPFTVEAEVETLRHHRATHLLVKNAGGAAARTKVTAAGQLGLPIVIVDRPPPPPGALTTPEAAFDWVKSHL